MRSTARRRGWTLLVAVALGVGLAACGASSKTSGSAGVTQSSAVAATGTTATGTSGPTSPTSTTGTTATSSSVAESPSAAKVDQQVQALTNAINQMDGDLSSADKATANGG